MTSGLRFFGWFHMHGVFAVGRVLIRCFWSNPLNPGHVAEVTGHDRRRRLSGWVLRCAHVPGHHLPAAGITALVHCGLDGLEVGLRFVVGDGGAARYVVDLDFLHAAQVSQLLLDSAGAQRR